MKIYAILYKWSCFSIGENNNRNMYEPEWLRLSCLFKQTE